MEFINNIWLYLNPAFVPTIDYLIGWPILYGIIRITDVIVGKKVRTKVLKIIEILTGWTTTLVIFSLCVGVVIKVVHLSTTLKFKFLDSKIESFMRSVITLFLLLLLVLCFSIIVVWQLRIKDVQVAYMHEELVYGENKLLEDIWCLLKNEIKLVQREIGVMSGRNNE